MTARRRDGAAQHRPALAQLRRPDDGGPAGGASPGPCGPCASRPVTRSRRWWSATGCEVRGAPRRASASLALPRERRHPGRPQRRLRRHVRRPGLLPRRRRLAARRRDGPSASASSSPPTPGWASLQLRIARPGDRPDAAPARAAAARLGPRAVLRRHDLPRRRQRRPPGRAGPGRAAAGGLLLRATRRPTWRGGRSTPAGGSATTPARRCATRRPRPHGTPCTTG